MPIRTRFILALIASLLAPASALAADAPKALRIERITPAGEDVTTTRQIVIEFNRAVVPLGRMERRADEVPATFSPEIPCQWRWLNTSTLACNLDDAGALIPATAYSLTVAPGIRAEDGATIAKPVTHRFVTERPAVRYQSFVGWASPSTPVVRLFFNQPVMRSSVAEHTRFVAGGNAIAASVRPMKDDSATPERIGRDEARRIWEVQPRRALPEGSAAMLRISPGVIAAQGKEPGIATHEVAFDTYPALRFAGVHCTDLNNAELTFVPGATARGKCDPMAPIRLAFTAPVPRSAVMRELTITPSLGGAKEEEEEEDISYLLNRPHKQGQLYYVSLPHGMKAATDFTVASERPAQGFFSRLWRSVLSLFNAKPHSKLEDAFGRTLQERFSLSFATDHRKPNFEMPNTEAVLEHGVDSEVPLYVNNLDQVTFDYQRLDASGAARHSYGITPPKVQDVQFAIPAEVRGMLGDKPGALYATLSTTPAVNKYERAHRLFAQVTPYSVHLKLGHFRSLAWVTDFATGKPVQGARVSLYEGVLTDLGIRKDIDSATTDASGLAILPGSERFDPKDVLADAWEDKAPRLMLRVDKGSDMALLPLMYDFSVDIWRASNGEVYPYTRQRYGHLRSWGTTAQGVYRAGQRMQYKLYARNESNRTLVAPPKGDYTLEIVDPTGKVVETKPAIAFSAFGAYSGEWAIPEHAVMGWYQFRLTARFAELDDRPVTLDPMRVLVSDFTPAAFKVKSELAGERFAPGDAVEVTTLATLYSGGAYGDASARITAQIRPRSFEPKAPALQGFRFDSGEDESTSDVFQTIAPLSDKGQRTDRFTLSDAGVVYGTLTVESAVEDARGKYIAAESRAPYVGRDRFVGLKSDRFVYEAGKEASIAYAVTDAAGEIAPGSSVTITFEKRETKTARVKGAGNAYTPRYTSEWVKADSCTGRSAEVPTECRFTPNSAGSYRAVAEVKDSKGRTHRTEQWLWVSGSEYVLWDDGENNALPLVPEQAEYKVGDTARYLVRNPYPGAEALVTIERYGVIDAFTTTLEGSTPTISFEVKPDYLPGFYLSVVAVSPRVDKPHGKVGELDLGKPGYRIGYLEVPVKDPYKEIAVTAKVERSEYRPRDEVQVSLHAAPKKPGAKEPIELTAIVLDEAVFDLITDGRRYFDPYAGLFTLDGLDLRNFSLLTRLIGRQGFEKKGANPGGDGGVDLSMRNLFKFVAYWNPSLVTDANGNASFRFEAPDNLTGWKVLALAATPSDRFGLGEGSFTVNRPTEIRPAMPNQVSEGDTFTAQFTVMNRTDKERTLKVEIEAQGNLDAEGRTASLEQEVTLAPYKRTTISLPLVAGRIEEDRDAPPGAIHFTARAGDAEDSDGLTHSLDVRKSRTLVTAAQYGSTTEDRVTTSLAFPDAMRTDVGDVSVVLSPSIITHLDGAFRYMYSYTYGCWEQRLSRAVMAAQYGALKPYLAEDVVWKGADTLPQQVLDAAANFQTPGGGMAYFTPRDDYADPYLSAYTALAFHWLADAGYTVPADVSAKLHGYLRDLLRRDAVPDFYSRGMTSDVRAMALAALAAEQQLSTADVSRYLPHIKEMGLMGKAQMLSAANAMGMAEQAREVLDTILAQGIESGGKLSFNETYEDEDSRILATPARDNCAVLSAMLTYTDVDYLNDKPEKLVRSIIAARAGREHWENTQENLFCMQALRVYARAFEDTTPAMDVTASLGGTPFGQARFASLRDAPRTLTRPIDAADKGRSTEVALTREGDGRLYYATRLSYAPSDGSANAQNAGIALVREYSVEREGKWVLLASPAEVKRGELVRVDLYASLPTARHFVVIDDPVPGGLEPVNRDLATSSKLDADAGKAAMAGGSYWFRFGEWLGYGVSRWSFYHQEIRHDAVRFYSDYLPAGNYHLSYTAQAIATGSFSAAPAKAEEMYDPDIFGTAAATTLQVGEKAP